MIFKIIKQSAGGFIVKDEYHDNVFASTRVDEALMFIRDKMTGDALAPSIVGANLTATQIKERMQAKPLMGPDFTDQLDAMLTILKRAGYSA